MPDICLNLYSGVLLIDDIEKNFAHVILRDHRTTGAYAKVNYNDMTLIIRELQAAREKMRPDHIIDESLSGIMRLICIRYKVDPYMLKRKSKKKIYAYPRQVYCYLCSKYSNSTLVAIAKSINRKNHTSIIYCIDQIKSKMKTNDHIRYEIELLEKELKGNV